MKINSLKTALPALVLAGAFAAPASAMPIAAGTYNLNNHPAGNATPPLYGLRLDELIDAGDGHDVFTFDFNAPTSAMTLTWNGTDTITISGTIFGGLDINSTTGSGAGLADLNGNGYADAFEGNMDIAFVYKDGVDGMTITAGPDAGGFDDIVVTAAGDSHGTVGLNGGMSGDLGDFNLVYKANGAGEVFTFGDEDGSGYRGQAGLNGWGWLNHCPVGADAGCDVHHAASDWLFTVPEPAPLALLGLGLLGFAIGRRARS